MCSSDLHRQRNQNSDNNRNKETFTHIRPVQPKSHAAFHTLELDVDGLALHGFRQLEVFYIACHRIEPLRDLARLYFFTAIHGY